MAKQKKTGFGTYITTLVVDSDLTATEARLFAFMQLHVDYRTGVFATSAVDGKQQGF